ncbi:MAG: sigma-70 family RNA polymerase sigma factor [Saprospiraceae bacterium]|nr:sigma-70 family RNA polymerase sigma factor [Saprospiraceae bacterium]
MKYATLTIEPQLADAQNRQIQETVRRERQRLLAFIRQRIPRQDDAEDILQDVFFEFTEMYRLMKPVEQIASWLFTVARNKITDRYRKKKPLLLEDVFTFTNTNGDDEPYLIDELLPAANIHSADVEMMRDTIMESLTEALEELPAEQRDVFIWHELEDKSFKEIAAETGVTVNTLLSRKRYAVLFLRERLKSLYEDLVNN